MLGKEGRCSESRLGSDFCGAMQVPPQQVGHSGWAELEEDAAGDTWPQVHFMTS